MITDNLKYCEFYTYVHPAFEAAFDFLQNFDVKSKETGRIDIAGDDIYALISEGNSPTENTWLEAHRRYIDLHYVIEGCDKIGFCATDKCRKAEGDFNDTGDYILYADLPEYYIKLNPGDFAVCFPQDAHVPLQGAGRYRKIVIKILI
jgi:biofilm protein TabA